MTFNEAEEILKQFTQSESLLRHAKSVSLVMEAYAVKLGEPSEKWAVTGLLHDADYEKHPDQHPNIIVDLLKEKGESEIAHAISAHYTKWGVPYDTLLDKALLACDELTGFIIACSHVRPEKINGMKAKSVTKKLKDKSFAAKVERDEVYKGTELLGVELSEHITFIISVLQQNQKDLSLN